MRTLSTIYLLAAVVLCSLTTTSVAKAVSCTVTGTLKVEPMDGYYCDTSISGLCAGWLVTNLDSARGASAKPLQYMRVELWQGSTFLKKTFTSSTGTYSMTVTLPGSSCAGQSVTLQYWMDRVHEADVGLPGPRYRFSIVQFVDTGRPGPSGEDLTSMWSRHVISDPASLTGASTPINRTWTASAAPLLQTRLMNLYFTLNATISEVVTWSASINNRFAQTFGGADGILRVIYGPGFTGNGGGADAAAWSIVVGYDVYNLGFISRHEIGHLVRDAIYNRTCMYFGNGCLTYFYNYDEGRTDESCEYGSIAFNEAYADFYGMRSATLSDTNVWGCGCANNANQDVCTEVSNSLSTVDAYQVCPGGGYGFYGAGDRWVTSSSSCKKVRADAGCACAVDGSGYCTLPQLHGWRNAINDVRYLWDLVDTSSDGGWDDTDFTIGSLITALQGMPTTYGVDGGCREAEHATLAECNPVTDGDPVTGGTGSRDAHNPRDISDLLAGDQVNEMSINCVGLATDN